MATEQLYTMGLCGLSGYETKANCLYDGKPFIDENPPTCISGNAYTNSFIYLLLAIYNKQIH